MNVQTNIGRDFLNLVSKHFPKNHRYSKIFNKNNIKVSYSCTDNLQTIIKKHNRKILETSRTLSTAINFNCRKKDDCPLKNSCLTSSVIYNANVTTKSDTTGKDYIGRTELTFKRYTQHATQALFSEQKLFKQHGNIEAYLHIYITNRRQNCFCLLGLISAYLSDRPGPRKECNARRSTDSR